MRNNAKAIPCAIRNGGSVWVGAAALSAGTFKNACAINTNTLSYAQNLILRVRDNGRGIPPDIAASGKEGHFGLVGMRERAQRLRARLTFSSPQGSGTLVELVVPEKIAFRSSLSSLR